jgi:type IV pilus assembly protein PilX
MFIKSSPLQNQSGVVMVIGLIMLLLLTLIGITASQVTGLEEKMAGNSRDQNIAFQAAEAVLRDGEDMIENGIVSLSAFSGAPYYSEDDAHPDYRASTSWNSTSSSSYATSMPLVHSQPRYYIKYIGTDTANSDASINIGVYGESSSGATVSRFTVTARGTGRQDNSQVFLQSHYAKKF